jgi:UDP-arabinose 4-epimerase
MRAERSGEYHEPEPHLIPLALRASAGFGPDRQVYGTDYPIPTRTRIPAFVITRMWLIWPRHT